jgi:hypothetical protein
LGPAAIFEGVTGRAIPEKKKAKIAIGELATRPIDIIVLVTFVS